MMTYAKIFRFKIEHHHTDYINIACITKFKNQNTRYEVSLIRNVSVSTNVIHVPLGSGLE